MILKQAIKDLPECLRDAEGLKVEEGRDGVTISLRDFMEGLAKLCRTSTHPDTAVREQLGNVAGLIEGALAAQHLKREQEPAPYELRKTIIEELYKRHNGLSPQWIDDFADFVVRVAAQPPQELVSLREDALFQAANTAARNLATSMNLRQHPDSCECYGCGLNRAVVNFALARAKENVRPIVERELRAEKWAGEAALTRGASE